ncbi:MAG: peptidylprolyl isomerase [Hyphomicrobiales bacterium]|nr:peptidylprolyl isomerase [Hyphomicrobiales bacterium]
MTCLKATRRMGAGFASLGLAFALGLGLAGGAEAKVLAKVNGVEITDEDVKVALDDIGAGLPQQVQGPEREAYVLDYLIDLKIVARKAEAEKMGDGADFARRMAYQRDKALMEGLLSKVAKDATTDAALKSVYDDAAKAQKPETEVQARHILVPTEEEAQAALKRVKAGEDFAKVADEVSKDPGSQGGELGWFTRDRMVPEFADAAFKLDKGQISDPVKSQFGWHVIQVEDKREKSFPDFDTVKEQVSHYVVQKAQTEQIVKLREGAKIEKTEAAPVVPAPGDAAGPAAADAKSAAPDTKPAASQAKPATPAGKAK